MNNQEKLYYIYKHTSPSGKVYVGQTCQKVWSRWSYTGNTYKESSILWNAIKKYGWSNFSHEILLDGLSKSEANYAERYLIKWYKLHKISYNITDGGEGTLGFTPWNKGLSMSEETKAKISKAKKGHQYGPQSPLHRLHKAAAHKIPIVMVSIDDPKLYQSFASAKDAEMRYGFNRKNINRSLRNSTVHAYKYFWFYKNQFTVNNYLEKLDAYNKAQKYYKKETVPDWVNINSINLITDFKLK